MLLLRSNPRYDIVNEAEMRKLVLMSKEDVIPFIFAFVNRKYVQRVEPLLRFWEGEIDGNTTDSDGVTLLQAAIRTEDVRMVQLILETGPRADLNYGGPMGDLPVHLILLFDTREKHANTLRMLDAIENSGWPIDMNIPNRFSKQYVLDWFTRAQAPLHIRVLLKCMRMGASKISHGAYALAPCDTEWNLRVKSKVWKTITSRLSIVALCSRKRGARGRVPKELWMKLLPMLSSV